MAEPPPRHAPAIDRITASDTRRPTGQPFMVSILAPNAVERQPFFLLWPSAACSYTSLYRHHHPPGRGSYGHEGDAPHPVGLLRRLSRQGGGRSPNAGPALPQR